MKHPQWSLDCVIYEVNFRQYSIEGSFKAFEPSLDRLCELGVTILWFMPISPIGEVKRKGSLGSYYSVADYKGVNPEFGTLNDLKSLINRAHSLGMKVIFDMVANHTAWDNCWIVEGNDDWYEQSENGEIVTPFDWTDTAKLNYSNKEMRREMISSMRYWIEECDIDGYRQDMAGLVPVEFWQEAISSLKEVKEDIFMLGEVESPEYLAQGGFDSCYAWEMSHFLERIAQGKDSVEGLRNFLYHDFGAYSDSMKMNFISNHDENSWQGTEFERYGDALPLMRVFNFVYSGIPLIYSGEEAGSNVKLEFFEKDLIDWSGIDRYTPIYKALTELRRTHPALRSGGEGGVPYFINSSQPENMLAFKRCVGDRVVIALFNMTPYHIQPAFYDDDYSGEYKKLLFEDCVELKSGEYDPFAPWEFKVYFR